MKYFVRGVTMFVYGILAIISLHILFLLAFINTVIWLALDEPNVNLSRVIKNIGLYLGEIAAFLSLRDIDDEYPFPLSHRPFPQGDDEA